MNKTVLHLRSSGGVFGAENVIIELCKRADDNGYTAIIGAIKNISDLYPEFLKIAEGLDLKTVVFSCKNQFDFNCARQIKNYAKNNAVSILHTHGYKEDYFGIISNTKLPKIATNHLWKKMFLRNKIYCGLDSFFLKFYDAVVGVSDEIVLEMEKRKIKNAFKIANGIDVSRFHLQEKSGKYLNMFGIDKSAIVIVMISSLSHAKRHTDAIKAFADISKENKFARLLIVGDGEKESEIKDLALQLGLGEYVIFAGKQTDIPAILSIADIFLLPSLIEGLPMALLEAMAAQKAVVATSVGEIPNVIVNNVNGLLIKPQDTKGIKEAVLDLIKNENKRKELGKNAYRTVQQKYSSEYMAKNYYNLYNDILKSNCS